MSNHRIIPDKAVGVFRGLLLAVIVVALLAGILGLIAGVGWLRLVSDRSVASRSDVQGPGADSHSAEAPDSSGEPAQTRPTASVADAGAPHTIAVAGALPPAAVAEKPKDQPPPVAPPLLPAVASASLLSVDDHSAGGWVGQYGMQGFYVAMTGAAPHWPAGVHGGLFRSNLYMWEQQATDVRRVEHPRGPIPPHAGQWFSGDNFSLDLDLRGADKSYQVALYLLDWDSDSRVQRLDVVDADSGKVLLTRTDDHFKMGRYVILRLSGHLVLRFTHAGGANCTLSGIFFNDLPAQGHQRSTKPANAYRSPRRVRCTHSSSDSTKKSLRRGFLPL